MAKPRLNLIPDTQETEQPLAHGEIVLPLTLPTGQMHNPRQDERARAPQRRSPTVRDALAGERSEQSAHSLPWQLPR